jgi:MoaA/NifB/PqqE/SkfB family radical SAM enzyme
LSLKLVHRPVGGQVTLLEEKDRYLTLLGARFGRRFWEYRKRWALAEERRYLGPWPLSLDLAINSGCQLRCPMCPLPARPEAPKRQELPDWLYRRLMDQAREGAIPALTLGLGSEPLLHSRPHLMVKEAVRAGIMDIRLGTNGLLLTEPLMDALIDSGLTRLEISLDAAEPVAYRAIRGGDLVELEKKIHLFLNKRAQSGAPWPLLRVSFLKLELNKNQLGPFIARWRGLADLISIQKPIWFAGSKLPPPPPKTVLSVPCGQPWQRLGVTYDGHVWPCCSWYGENLLAMTSQKTSLATIWRSQSLTDLRARLTFNRPTPECLACAQAGAF